MKRNPGSGRRVAIVPLVACLLAFLLRLLLIDAQSIWWDEAISIHLATSGVGELLANRAANIHPPLYYLLLKGWVSLAGTNAFAVRFFSAGFNVLLVPAAYAFARRRFGRRAASITSLLAASVAVYVIYSQEARVYALLPVVYLALLALTERLRERPAATWRHWALLGIVEAVGLHLHYAFALGVVYVNLVLLVHILRQRSGWVRWLVSVALATALSVPWIVAVGLNWGAVVDRVGLQSPFVEPVTLDHFVRLLWSFQWTGLTRALRYRPLQLSTATLAALLPLSVVALLRRPDTRRPSLRLLGHWLAPLSGALLIWWIRPLSHPRYVALFAIALFLFWGYALARLLEGRWWERVLVILMAAGFLVTSAISLQAYYVQPAFAKDETRKAAATIAATAGAGDLVLVPPEDWSVPYYYAGPAQVEMPWPGDRPADWDRLAGFTQQVEAVYLVDYDRGSRDPQGILPFALEAAGDLVDRHDVQGLFVRIYQLDRTILPPQFDPVDARFGPLRLTGAWVEQGVPADTGVAVALRWRLEEPGALGPAPCRVGLRLQDAGGWRWASIDDWLLDAAGQLTGDWADGQEINTYHVLPLPPGTPPLTFDVSLGVYQVDEGAVRPLDLVDSAGAPQGQSLDLGEVALAPPLGLETDPYGVAGRVPVWETPVALDGGLTLVGAAVDREQVAPGQSLFVTLHWRAEGRPVPVTATLSLQQGGVDLARAVEPVGGGYPADRWQEGQSVIEPRRLVVPAGASTGPAAVRLHVGEREIDIGYVDVTAEAHVFVPPPMEHPLTVRFGDVAELLGYDLVQTEVTSSQLVTLTLYWRALEGAAAADYTVFTHILAVDGHLVGQHDGPPAEGRRPTPGWIGDEIVVDRHPMAFREVYTGPAQIEIGLYDPVTLDRVPIAGGADSLILPTPLNVVQP